MVKVGDLILTDAPVNAMEVFSTGDGSEIFKLSLDLDGQYLVTALAIRDLILLTYSSGTLIILLRESMTLRAMLESSKVTNRLVAFDDQHVMLAGDDS
jgi:hypothetical protein